MLITLHRRKLRLRNPLVTAHGSTTDRRIIEITAQDGDFHGHGEAAPLPGFGLETFDESLAALEQWATNPELLPESPAALSGAATALENLEKSRLRRSGPKGAIAVQALVSTTEISSVETQISDALANGYLAIKMKVAATDTSTDISRVQAAAAVLGSKAALRLDANGGWSMRDALAVLSSVDLSHIDLVEEPTSNPLDWQQINEETGVNIGADEQLTNQLQVEMLLDLGAAQTFVLKPSVIGGPLATRRMAALAADNGVDILISSFLDGPIGLRSARDLALELAPNKIHGLGTAALFVDELPADVQPVDGYLRRS